MYSFLGWSRYTKSSWRPYIGLLIFVIEVRVRKKKDRWLLALAQKVSVKMEKVFRS